MKVFYINHLRIYPDLRGILTIILSIVTLLRIANVLIPSHSSARFRFKNVTSCIIENPFLLRDGDRIIENKVFIRDFFKKGENSAKIKLTVLTAPNNLNVIWSDNTDALFNKTQNRLPAQESECLWSTGTI